MSADKKVAAALAAVASYIEEEEAALQLQAAMGGMPAGGVRRPQAAFHPWSANGRQMQMQMRNLMQLRALRTKPGM